MHYDRRSDTLLIYFFGRDRDAISVPIGRAVSVLVAPDSDEVIGLHIVGFLARHVIDVPEAVGLLDFADLRGITLADVHSLQLAVLGIASDHGFGVPGKESRNFPSRR